MENHFLKLKFTLSQLLVLFLSIVAWVFFLVIERVDFTLLFVNYFVLFFLFIAALKVEFTWQQVLVIGVVFRLILFPLTPNLSQDFYRFIWDGNLVFNGLNPYLKTPEQWVNIKSFYIENKSVLIDKMGSLSSSNYSNYPPFNQYLFAIASYIGDGSIWCTMLVLRIQIILADIGLFFVLRKLLQSLGKPDRFAYLFFLNPFVIIEMTGNLHYEGVMLFFLVASFYFLYKNRLMLAAIMWAFSISTKLLPLMLLPLFFRFFDWKKVLQFYLIIGITLLLLISPFIASHSLENYFETVMLWFNRFEFNASIYYLLRWVGFQLTGYNQIDVIGKILTGLIFILIMLISLLKSNSSIIGLIKNSYIIFLSYFLLSTTVHPWYIMSPLIFSIFLPNYIALVWSFLVFLSYSAYQHQEVEELPLLLFIEYGALLMFSIYEWKRSKNDLIFLK